jgi:hypothetical protein
LRLMDPRLLRDIRYFESSFILGTDEESSPDYAGKTLKVGKAAIALGQRIACKCEELGVTIDKGSHLYVCLTPALAENKVLPVDFADEKWQRYVMYGLNAAKFNKLSPRERLAQLREATFRILHKIAPASRKQLQWAYSSIRDQGEKLRIVVRTLRTRKFLATVSHTVPVFPAPSKIVLSVTDLQRNQTKEVLLAKTKYYDEAVFMVDRMVIVGGVVTVHPRKSFRAQLHTRGYELPLRADLGKLFGT